MKNLPKIAPFLIFALILSTQITFAQSPNPTESPSTEKNDEVTENLKERLKSAMEDADINLVSGKTPRAYFGQITDVIQDTIVLEDKSGKKNVSLSDDSTIIRTPGSKEIELDNIQIEDYLIAIGYLKDEDDLTATRLIVSSSDLTPPEKLTGIATIKTINRYSFTLTDKDGEELELFFTSKTIYKNKSEVLEQTNLLEGDRILYTAGLDSDDDWSATVVMQLSSGNLPN